MTNLLLAQEKLEAARLVLAAAEAYQATTERLLAESRKLADEALALLAAPYDE